MITDLQRAQLDTLNRRQRDCLRLVPLRTTDEIARELGLKSNTVEGYIKEARARLGGVTRDAAARLLLESESDPQNLGGPSLGLNAGLELAPEVIAQHGSTADRVSSESLLREEVIVPEWTLDTPVKHGLFDRWQTPGDISPMRRLAIVGGLLIGLSFGFGVATVGVVGALEVIERLR